MRRASRFAICVLLALGAACNHHSQGPTEPEPTPPPAPATEDPDAFSCKLPAMPEHGACRYEAMLFYAQYEQAIDEVVARHPEYFDLHETRGCDTCYFIKDGHAFYRAFVNRLEHMGFCAQCDEECGIKNSNAFNEQYDAIISQGYLRRGIGAYRGTCYPAAF